MKSNYIGKPTPYFHFARREMLEFIPVNATKILEVGCGEAEFAATLKSERSVHITGIEPFLDAATIAKTRIDRVLETDVDNGLNLLDGQEFECVVCNDVLEHLIDPWAVLARLKNFVTRDGVVVVSLSNMRFMPVLKSLVLNADWQYEKMGVMDRTHLRFFTRRSMSQMFMDCGYQILDIKGINSIELPWKFAILNLLVLGALSDAKHQQYACVLKPVSK